jgi:cystathionine beta-lyase/cystathionine gamma-synthase
MMSHSDMPEDQRLAVGVTRSLVRLSVGLEEVSEIIEDLEQALDEI